jgi:hypothetical protein
MPAEQPDPSEKSLIFISHSSKDKLVADAICARLENQGIRCWIAPRDVNPGRDYSDQIEEALERSSVFVTVISSGSNSSRHVKSEIDRAFSLGHVIVPFRVENIELDKGLAYYLSKTHWLDAVNPPMEQHIDRLAATIRKLADQDALPAPPPVPAPPPPAPIPQPARSNKILLLALGLAGFVAIVAIIGLIFLMPRHETATNQPIVTPPPIAATQPSATVQPAATAQPAATPVEAVKPSIEGAWTITEARTLEGGSYGGSVRFFGEENRYQVSWQTAAGNYSGAGFFRDNKLCVGFSERSFGVVFYKIEQDGTLNGRWMVTGAGADESDGTEKAIGGAPGKVEGEYSIIGSNPGSKNRYGGKLRIKRTGDTYQLQWNVNDSITTGVGIRVDDDLYVAFGGKDQVYGVVAYTFDGKRAKGLWTLGGASQTGTEDLVKQ